MSSSDTDHPPVFVDLGDDAGMGTAILGDVPKCNGCCHTQGDYPDWHPDCPVHGHEVEVCTKCNTVVDVVERSIETAGQEETERDYDVTRLSCGHEIADPVKRQVLR